MDTAIKSGCPFCRANSLLKGEILAESAEAFLIKPQGNSPHYLIIPNDHVETIFDLPDTWWGAFKQIADKIPDLAEQYNISLNYGREAGQTLQHLHFWIVAREAGQPSSGKGLASLINANTQE